MSTNVKRILYKKIAESLENVENANKIIYHSHLQQKQSGAYSFALPLKTRQYDVRNTIQTILNSDIKTDLNEITIEKDVLFIDLCRNDCVKQCLENNYHEIVPTTFTNKNKNVVIDFSSPNIAKPFHLGHLRSTIIGNYVANINSYLKNYVTKINYLGDWGTQYGLVQLGMNMCNFNSEDIEKSPIQHLYNAYVFANKLSKDDPTILSKAKEIFRELETGESSAHEEWKLFRKYTVEELQKTYKRIGITFDEYHWESMYSVTNIKEVLSLMEQMHLLINDEENRKAINLNSKQVVPLIKSDGTSLYLMRDVAAAIDRYKKYNFDLMCYVVDNTQGGHFNNLIEILNKMDMPWVQRLRHIRYGRIHGMSSRKGTAIFLHDILDELRDVAKEKQSQSKTTKVSLDISDNSSDILGISSLIIHDLKQKRQRDYTFNWDTAFNINGDTGLKLQYVHSRLVSLEENSGATLISECDPTVLKEPIVDNMILIISNFENVVLRSYEDLEPCILVAYLFQLRSVYM